MDAQAKWPMRRQPRGIQAERATFAFEPAYLAALRQYAKQEGVSQAALLVQLSLKDSNLKQIYREFQRLTTNDGSGPTAELLAQLSTS